jgi:hypothetical protein
MNLGPRKALAGDGQHTLDLGGMSRSLEGDIPKERVYGGQPQVSATHAQTSISFQMIEKRCDQRGIDRRQY